MSVYNGLGIMGCSCDWIMGLVLLDVHVQSTLSAHLIQAIFFG